MDVLEGLRFVNEHLIVWMIYLAACIGMFAVFWRITRNWPRWLRYPLRFLAVIFLLVPTLADPAQRFLAPAFMVLGFEWLLHGVHAAQPAISAFAIALVAALLFVVAALALRYWWARRNTANTATPVSPGSV